MRERAIIVTGLPASGKSTIGRALSVALDIPYLDKDDILERLFDERGVGDRHWRRRLSRESDDLFEHEASKLPEAILISHWRPYPSMTETGTPLEWLPGAFRRIIEVYCACAPEQAARRFLDRKRHAGHLDRSRSAADVEVQMRHLAAGYPLGIGHVLVAGDGVNVPDLADRIRRLSTTQA